MRARNQWDLAIDRLTEKLWDNIYNSGIDVRLFASSPIIMPKIYEGLVNEIQKENIIWNEIDPEEINVELQSVIQEVVKNLEKNSQPGQDSNLHLTGISSRSRPTHLDLMLTVLNKFANSWPNLPADVQANINAAKRREEFVTTVQEIVSDVGFWKKQGEKFGVKITPSGIDKIRDILKKWEPRNEASTEKIFNILIKFGEDKVKNPSKDASNITKVFYNALYQINPSALNNVKHDVQQLEVKSVKNTGMKRGSGDDGL